MADRFDLGRVIELDSAPSELIVAPVDTLASAWSCELAGQRLDWGASVRRLFGYPADHCPLREEVVTLYEESSRAAMERLRAHAIRHRRGFTLDIAIRPVDGGRRWVRLVTMPVCEGKTVTCLKGWKADVSHLYGDTTPMPVPAMPLSRG
ncbi:hypothetical protein [Sphingomonas sp. S6]|jgi:PAS domain-containing protein|uniref:hypothetical protein n=1 Tax=Sphingomonas sp. S6 TaxID=3368600 RepID=UPI000FB53F6A|nr:hypothetical protein [uncultured Sphingomonas sp.]RTL20041.1 MAG: hypothetical protein EKK50_05375 [Sphingomonadaceae bacterium]